MFSTTQCSGKHLIIDIKNIPNTETINNINNIEKLKTMMDNICEKYEFQVLNKIEHKFDPQGLSIIYLLSESHMTIHTFPERNYIAFDLYTCRNYPNNDVYTEIHKYITEETNATYEPPIIIDRYF
jgi:S-adenosylmethionine decarboxylase proenzyme